MDRRQGSSYRATIVEKTNRRVVGRNLAVYIVFIVFGCIEDLSAQYAGGIGNGDHLSSVYALLFNGINFNMLNSGGEGRGDMLGERYTSCLNGENFQIAYNGGNGRGEQMSEALHRGLSGENLKFLFPGGQGHGDHNFTTCQVGLDGENLNTPFKGGSGRGDIQYINDALSLAGDNWGVMYTGANGKGDYQLDKSAIILGGEEVGVLFSGGIGRGDIGHYSFGEILNCTYYSIWTGSVSTAWENPANWQCGELPNRYSDVFIPTTVPHFPYITVSPVEIRNLTLDNSSMLHVIGVPLNVLGGPQ